MNLKFNSHPAARDARRSEIAFTLIEVMIATAIFFMAMFAILGVLSAGVHAATLLRTNGPTAGMVATYFSVSNKIEEGSLTGDFDDIAGYQGYKWVSDATEITNGLMRMDFVVVDPHGVLCSSLKDVIFYKPDSGGNRMGLQPPRQ
ncbi:MAG TPA: hypothetical protein VGO59_17750 [Verrucomicrobiae bacterium]